MHTVVPKRHVRRSPGEHSHLTRPVCCSTDQSRYAERCCNDFWCDALYDMGVPLGGIHLGVPRPSVTYQDMAGTGPACVCSVVACAHMPHGDRDSLGGVLMGLPMVMGLATRVECVPPCARAHVGLHRRVLYQPPLWAAGVGSRSVNAVQPDRWGPQQATLEGGLGVAMLPMMLYRPLLT